MRIIKYVSSSAALLLAGYWAGRVDSNLNHAGKHWLPPSDLDLSKKEMLAPVVTEKTESVVKKPVFTLSIISEASSSHFTEAECLENKNFISDIRERRSKKDVVSLLNERLTKRFGDQGIFSNTIFIGIHPHPLLAKMASVNKELAGLLSKDEYLNWLSSATYWEGHPTYYNPADSDPLEGVDDRYNDVSAEEHATVVEKILAIVNAEMKNVKTVESTTLKSYSYNQARFFGVEPSKSGVSVLEKAPDPYSDRVRFT